MSEQERKPKRTYFRPTTPQQRRLLFETYERTGSVEKACQTAHVARRTFYYWLPRFREGGSAALERERSRAPHRTRIPPMAEETVQEVIDYKRAHAEAGYRRIADELRKAHGWQRVISPTQVRRILLKAGLVTDRSCVATSEPVVSIHAGKPETTANIDLCVVPITHDADQPLQSVSMAEAEKAAFSPRRGGDADPCLCGASLPESEPELLSPDERLCCPPTSQATPPSEAAPAPDHA